MHQARMTVDKAKLAIEEEYDRLSEEFTETIGSLTRQSVLSDQQALAFEHLVRGPERWLRGSRRYSRD